MVRKSSAEITIQAEATGTGVRSRFESKDMRREVITVLQEAKITRASARDLVARAAAGEKVSKADLRKAEELADKSEREIAADELGISYRTLNRRIKELDLYEDLDKLGLIQNPGPPRGAGASSWRQAVILKHIKKNFGEIDYDELAMEMYNHKEQKFKQRCYVALSDLKAKGVIAVVGDKWFIV